MLGAVGDVTGLRGEFYFCPVIGRQFVLFEREGVVGVYLDPAAKQAAEAATFAKLALLLSKGVQGNPLTNFPGAPCEAG